MTVEELSKRVIDSIDDSWSTIEKIRYVYLEVGKFVEKHTDFFYSVDKKLGEKQLSLDEIEEIYEDDKTSGDLKVICRSASFILQHIYTKLGIESELIKTNNTILASDDEKEFLLNHWILVVKDGDKNYFMTLTADLAYIQSGMETRHFAANIPYKRKYGDKEMQIYQGDEIKPTLIDRHTLKEIDRKIGYLRNQYNLDDQYKQSSEYDYNYDDASIYMLNNELVSNKLYTELMRQNTPFYRGVTEFKNGDKTISFIDTPIDEITEEDWKVWIKILCKAVHRKIEKIIGFKIFIPVYYDEDNWNYDEWLCEICKNLQRYLFQFSNKTLDHLWIGNEFDYNKWSRALKKENDFNYDVIEHDNILLMLDKTNVLVKGIMSGKKVKNFMKLLNELSEHFISKRYLPETSLKDGIISTEYLANKFRVLFKRIFSCNECITDFNRMEYSEQIVIIKMIMEKMFPELTLQNSVLENSYNENYSLVQNRIQVYSIKHKVKDYYAMVFHIVGDGHSDEVLYFYDPKKNKFEPANMLKIGKKFIIVSNRFKSKIEELENVSQKKNKR